MTNTSGLACEKKNDINNQPCLLFKLYLAQNIFK